MSESKLVRNAVGVGLTAFIPLPWVDEIVRRALLRSSLRAVAVDAGRPQAPEVIEVLSEDRASFLFGCFVAVFWWPVKKIFRTVLYFLTLKDVADWMSDAALRAEMVRMAVSQGYLPEHAAAVRDAMEGVLDAHTTSPVTRLLTRQPRPPMDWPAGSSTIYGLLGTLVTQAGGGKVLPAFAERLQRIGATSPRGSDGPPPSR